jgi:hypothetical protein
MKKILAFLNEWWPYILLVVVVILITQLDKILK